MGENKTGVNISRYTVSCHSSKKFSDIYKTKRVLLLSHVTNQLINGSTYSSFSRAHPVAHTCRIHCHVLILKHTTKSISCAHPIAHRIHIPVLILEHTARYISLCSACSTLFTSLWAFCAYPVNV